LGTGNILNFLKWGFLTADSADYTDFWVKNEGEGVNLQRLGKIGKIKTCENGWKLAKICEKWCETREKWCEKCENSQKYSEIFDPWLVLFNRGGRRGKNVGPYDSKTRRYEERLITDYAHFRYLAVKMAGKVTLQR